MDSRLELLADVVKNVASCCCPYLRLYRVSYFKTVDGKRRWVENEIMAYNYKDAAKREGLIAGLKLIAGRNCMVGRVIRK